MNRKTCKTCKHCGQCDYEGHGRCNKGLPETKPIYVKQDDKACEEYWDDQEGTAWQDRFGYTYRYEWLTNSFVRDQAGSSLPFPYLELLREVKPETEE